MVVVVVVVIMLSDRSDGTAISLGLLVGQGAAAASSPGIFHPSLQNTMMSYKIMS